MTCPNCRAEAAEGSVDCPKCGVVFAKWQVRGLAASVPAPAPRPMPSPEEIRAALSAAQAPPDRRGLETALFFLAMPVLVPALGVNWIMASRWGRIDAFMLAIDAFILGLFCLRSPRLLGVVAVSWLCSMGLWILRREKLERGIFLGYSNAVAYPLIFGGILAFIGAVWLQSARGAAWSWKGLYCLIPGALLLVWAVVRSRRE